MKQMQSRSKRVKGLLQAFLKVLSLVGDLIIIMWEFISQRDRGFFNQKMRIPTIIFTIIRKLFMIFGMEVVEIWSFLPSHSEWILAWYWRGWEWLVRIGHWTIDFLANAVKLKRCCSPWEAFAISSLNYPFK